MGLAQHNTVHWKLCGHWKLILDKGEPGSIQYSYYRRTFSGKKKSRVFDHTIGGEENGIRIY